MNKKYYVFSMKGIKTECLRVQNYSYYKRIY